LFFAKNKDQNETWLPLLEKAYAKAHGDFLSLSGGWIGEGLEDLSGGVTTELLTSDILDEDEFWNNELSKVNGEFLFGCSTGLLDGGYGERNGISEGHAYVVMDARTLKSGQRLLKLRYVVDMISSKSSSKINSHKMAIETRGARPARASGKAPGLMAPRNGRQKSSKSSATPSAATQSSGFHTKTCSENTSTLTARASSGTPRGAAASAGSASTYPGRRPITKSSTSSSPRILP
jgi:hypothetical protein